MKKILIYVSIITYLVAFIPIETFAANKVQTAEISKIENDFFGFYSAVAGAEDDDFLKGIAYLFHAQSFPCELIAGSFETVGYNNVPLCMPVAPAGSQCYDQLAAPAEIFRCALQCLVCILNEFLPALCGE